MTRSSIVAALVVTVLLALLIESRDEQGRMEESRMEQGRMEETSVERNTDALSPGAAPARAPGEVGAVPTARPVSPSPGPSILLDGTPDAGAPGAR